MLETTHISSNNNGDRDNEIAITNRNAEFFNRIFDMRERLFLEKINNIMSEAMGFSLNQIEFGDTGDIIRFIYKNDLGDIHPSLKIIYKPFQHCHNGEIFEEYQIETDDNGNLVIRPIKLYIDSFGSSGGNSTYEIYYDTKIAGVSGMIGVLPILKPKGLNVQILERHIQKTYDGIKNIEYDFAYNICDTFNIKCNNDFSYTIKYVNPLYEDCLKDNGGLR